MQHEYENHIGPQTQYKRKKVQTEANPKCSALIPISFFLSTGISLLNIGWYHISNTNYHKRYAIMNIPKMFMQQRISCCHANVITLLKYCTLLKLLCPPSPRLSHQLVGNDEFRSLCRWGVSI
ncbi:hypothetical protein CDAR_307481 [Caerostris darwini]|uniref:Uncharacterized protein n=1 Tax=Caerostris darwini TaxID=1538125 RepID=A0AAV4T5S8_9ARAC|nr:hypothetical protein CDAR_307481 [Caerostris darwini]